jgi:RND family efflux transporter MFP subunit
MEAKVRVPSLPGQEFVGAVAKIVPQADTRSRSFPVKVRVENPMPEGLPILKSGLFAEVRLPVGDPKRVVLVSKDAIVLGGPSPAVYVFEPGAESETAGTVRQVPVAIGLSTGGMVEVTGQIVPGEKVIVRGNERLAPGQQVHVHEVRGEAS